MRYDPRFLMCCLLSSFMLPLCGCSSDRKDSSRSVVDSLSDMERTKDELKAKPPKPQDEASTPLEEAGAAASGTFKVRFETSAGDFVVEAHRDWAPLGAERFYQLVKDGFYDECRFFRVMPGFMVQFGINGDPAKHRKWDRNIKDDPVRKSNRKGYVSFATSGKNTRTSQIFISYGNNESLDEQGFSPFAQVIEGMHNVEGIYSGYGERPNQGQIENVGNGYLDRAFPDLDYVKKARLIEDSSDGDVEASETNQRDAG